jgi:hypothetical protein
MEMLDILCLRLSSKGLMPVQIMKLLNDSFDIMKEGTLLSKALLKNELERKGWEKDRIMDDLTCDITILCLGSNEEYDVLQIPLPYNKPYALSN